MLLLWAFSVLMSLYCDKDTTLVLPNIWQHEFKRWRNSAPANLPSHNQIYPNAALSAPSIKT